MKQFIDYMGLLTYSALLVFELIIYNENSYEVNTCLPKQLLDIMLVKMNYLFKAPKSAFVELPKDFRLNMKRRPPIILGAH